MVKKQIFFMYIPDEESGHHNDHAKDYIETRYGQESIELVEKVLLGENLIIKT